MSGQKYSEVRAETAAEIAASKYPRLYLAIEYHRNTHGQPLRFGDDAPWVYDLYVDKSSNIVVMKSVQCGVTEYLTVYTFDACRRGLSVLYTLPGDGECAAFVQDRIIPLLQDIPSYTRALGHTDNVRMKKLWKGTTKFVGSNVRKNFTGYTAQVYIVDELDECDQTNIVFGQDRLSDAEHRTGMPPVIIKVGNPTIPAFGISEAYEHSDKKEWNIKCGHCNQWQPLDWFANVVDKSGSPLSVHKQTGKPIMVCRSCHQSINPYSEGKWIAEHPGVEISGYHISKLFTRQTTLDSLYESYLKGKVNETENQRFYNSDLGIPYTGSGDGLSLEVFQKCVLPQYTLPFTAEECIAGIDVGKVLHVRIDILTEGRRRMVYAGTIPNFDELAIVLHRYNVRLYVMDARPETHKCTEFINQNRGGFLCDFHPDASIIDLKIDNKTRMIKVGRTRSLDEATEAYLRNQIELPENWRSLDQGNWVAQMMAPVRKLDTKRQPPAFIWDEAGQPDHHRLADNYCHIAAKMCGFGIGRREMLWA